MVEKNPLILADAMDLGAKWGEEMGQEILDKLEEVKISKFNETIKEDCTKFKTGKFTYTYDKLTVSVVRKDGFQIET